MLLYSVIQQGQGNSLHHLLSSSNLFGFKISRLNRVEKRAVLAGEPGSLSSTLDIYTLCQNKQQEGPM